MLVLLAQMSSRVAAGCAGANSESCTTVPVPRSVSSSARLPGTVPPRKTQFLNVMFFPVTVTKPWKSFPVITAPLVEYVWLPVTAVSFVPGSTPVLPLPGFPVRGAGFGFGEGRWVGPVDRDAEALGAAEPGVA